MGITTDKKTVKGQSCLNCFKAAFYWKNGYPVAGNDFHSEMESLNQLLLWSDKEDNDKILCQWCDEIQTTVVFDPEFTGTFDYATGDAVTPKAEGVD